MKKAKRTRKNKFFCVALILVTLIATVLVLAGCDNSSAKLQFKINEDEKTCTVVGCIEAWGWDIVIPETYKGYTVTAIADKAFADKMINSVTFPSTIQSIGKEAFSRCSKLKAVYGLENCASLTKIDDFTFYECTSLEEISLPPQLRSIETFAFYSCINLRSIELPDSLETIDVGAFQNCASLSSINYPDSLVYIGSVAFRGCRSLQEITLPKNLAEGTMDRFLNCDLLENIYASEDSIYYSSIDGVLFSRDASRLYCYPSGKTAEVYTVPDNVTVINSYAFAYNEHLTELNIPKSVNSIYAGVFQNSPNLKTINYSGSVKEWQSIAKQPQWDTDSADFTVYCADGQIAKDGTVTYK